MKLEEKDLIVARPYKKVYLSGDSVVKVFEESHPKKYVFNAVSYTHLVQPAGGEYRRRQRGHLAGGLRQRGQLHRLLPLL